MEPAEVSEETVGVSTTKGISNLKKMQLKSNKISPVFANPDLILSVVIATLNTLQKPAIKSSLVMWVT